MSRWIGLDVSKSTISVREIYPDDTWKEYQFPYTERDLRAFEVQLKNDDRIAMEATQITYHLYERFKDRVSEVSIANPMKLKLISKSPAKNDRNDARKLAELLRVGYLPTIWIPDEEGRQDREILQHRYALGRDWTRVKNRIRALLGSHGLICPATDLQYRGAQLFFHKILSTLTWTAREKLESLLRQLRMLEEEMRIVNQVIETRADRYREVSLLMTVNGIGTLTAFTIMSIIGAITRFPRPESLANYAGLVPRQRSSGTHSWSGPIAKTGSKMLRWAVAEVVQNLVRHPGVFQKFYTRMCRRKPRGVALVACGRKLLEIIWHMLSHNEPFRDMNAALNRRKQRAHTIRPRAPRTLPIETLPALMDNFAVLQELSTGSSS
jgi:transposase